MKTTVLLLMMVTDTSHYYTNNEEVSYTTVERRGPMGMYDCLTRAAEVNIQVSVEVGSFTAVCVPIIYPDKLVFHEGKKPWELDWSKPQD